MFGLPQAVGSIETSSGAVNCREEREERRKEVEPSESWKEVVDSSSTKGELTVHQRKKGVSSTKKGRGVGWCVLFLSFFGDWVVEWFWGVVLCCSFWFVFGGREGPVSDSLWQCLESDRPDGQTVHPRAESRTCSVWCQSAVSESSWTKSRQEGTLRSQEHPEVTWCADGMILETHRKNRSMQVNWMNCASVASHAMRKMCAWVRTARRNLYTHRRVHDSWHCFDAKFC